MNSPRRIIPALVAAGLLVVAAPVAQARVMPPGCAISPVLHLTVCERNSQTVPIDTARSEMPPEFRDPGAVLGMTQEGMAITGPGFSRVLAGSAGRVPAPIGSPVAATTAEPPDSSIDGAHATAPAGVVSAAAASARREPRATVQRDGAAYLAYYTAVDHAAPFATRSAQSYAATSVTNLMQPNDVAAAEAPRAPAPVPEPDGLSLLGLGVLIVATRRMLPWLMRGSSRWRERQVFVARAPRAFPTIYADSAQRSVAEHTAPDRPATRVAAPVVTLASRRHLRRYVGGLH